MSLPERVGSVERLRSVEAFGLPEVYRGRDERLRRDVLLWPLRWGADEADDDRRSLCLHTATVASQLDDPRLVQVYDCLPADKKSPGNGADGTGCADDSVDWLVLESVEGRVVDARLPWRTRLRIAQDVAEILAELHARGAVHGGLDLDSLRLLGDSDGIKILAPGPSAWKDEETPSRSGDLLAFGRLLRQVFGAQLGRLEPLAAAMEWEAASGRPTAAEASRFLSRERLRPRRRRRLAVLWTLAVLLAVWAVSFTLSLRNSVAETVAAREDAVRAKAEAEELSDFLVGLFQPDVDGELASDLSVEPTARDLLERGARRIDRDFADSTQVRSRLLLALGEVYESLGSYDRARGLLEEALRLRQDDPDASLRSLAAVQAALGHLLRYQGEYEEALFNLESALAIQVAEHGEDHEDVAETLNGMAIVERRMGDYESAEANYLRSLAIRERVLGPMDPTLARGLNNLALLYYYQGRLDEAEVQYRRSLDIKKATLPANHPSIALGYNNLGNLMADRGRFEEAESFYLRSLELREEVSGADHPETASSLNNLGLLYFEWQRLELAETFLRRTLAVREQALGADHADYALSLSNLGALLEAAGRHDESQEALDEALEIQRSTLGNDHPDVGLSLDRLGALHLARGEARKAQDLLEESYEINRAALGDGNPDTAFSLVLLGRCALALGDASESMDRLGEAVSIYEAAGIQGAKMTAALQHLAAAQESAGLMEEAASTRARLAEMNSST